MLRAHWHFGVLLSSAYRKSKTFQCLMLCQCAGARETGREDIQDSWSELPKGIFCTIERHAQLGGLGQEPWIATQGLVGHWSASGEWLCCPSLIFLEFYPSLSLFFSLQLLLFFFFCFFCQLLNCLYLNHGFTFFWFSSPSYQGEVGKWLHGTYLLTELNHNSSLQEEIVQRTSWLL